MAANYAPQGSYRDIQVLSPTSVIDVMVLTAFTVPSHIYYEVNVPMEAFNAGHGDEYLTDAAASLEALLAEPAVQSVHWTTDLDSRGLVGDYAVATVAITPPKGSTGPFTTDVRFPMGQLLSGHMQGAAGRQSPIDVAVSQLEALAAS